jgi:hypothetical protein
MENVFSGLVVSKGKSSNAKYALTGDVVQAAIPAQCLAVAMACTEDGQTVENIAFAAVLKTKQDPVRIVRYYMPTLIKLGVCKKV